MDSEFTESSVSLKSDASKEDLDNMKEGRCPLRSDLTSPSEDGDIVTDGGDSNLTTSRSTSSSLSRSDRSKADLNDFKEGPSPPPVPAESQRSSVSVHSDQSKDQVQKFQENPSVPKRRLLDLFRFLFGPCVRGSPEDE